MMHLDLVVLITAPGVVHADDSVFLLALELIAIKELCLLVSVAKEQSHGTALLSLALAVSTILDHGTHWRNACSQPYHHLRFVLSLRDGDTACIHVARFLLLGSVVPEEVHSQAVSVLILVVIPIILDDAELDLVANHPVGTSDGLQAWLDGGHVVNQILHVRHG